MLILNMSDHLRRTFFPHHEDNNKNGTSKKNYNYIFFFHLKTIYKNRCGLL